MTFFCLILNLQGCKGNTFVEWIFTYYNLCRGCSAEKIIYEFCDFSKILGIDVMPFYCGFLVEEKKEGSIAISPDLLLVDKTTKKIIPVEIKCIMNIPICSSNVIREIKLARLQLNTVKKILSNQYFGYGIIVIMFIFNKNEKWNYTIRYQYY